jgi:DNA-binding NarL/FixJ family response regulator
VVATATPISPRRLREFGVAGYLPKPFPMEALVSTLERLAGRAPEPERVPTPEGDEPT